LISCSADGIVVNIIATWPPTMSVTPARAALYGT